MSYKNRSDHGHPCIKNTCIIYS